MANRTFTFTSLMAVSCLLLSTVVASAESNALFGWSKQASTSSATGTFTPDLELVKSIGEQTSEEQSLPKIHHWTTAKGARVYYAHAPQLPMIDLQITFDAGSARDGEQPGLSQITNRTFDEGANELDAGDIAARFESVGAEFSTTALRDMAILRLRTLTEEKPLTASLSTLETMLSSPSFNYDSINLERKRMIVRIQASQQSPSRLNNNAFFKAIYGNHPYSSPVLGTVESLEQIRRGDLFDFYERYYTSGNAVIALVGAIDKKQAETIAEQLSQAMPAGDKAAALPHAMIKTGGETQHVEFPSSQSHIKVGHPGIKRGDPDTFAISVGNYILGGGGFVSRITTEIREKRGLSYSSYSRFLPMHAEGPFMMGLQTQAAQTEEALTVLKQTLKDFIEQGPSVEEVTAAKRNLTGGFPLNLASNKNIVEHMSSIGFYQLPLDYLETYTQNINSVTLNDIKDAFKRRVSLDNLVTVIVGEKVEQSPVVQAGAASTP